MREAQQVELDSFASCVQSSLETLDLITELEAVAATTEADVRRKWGDKERFREWLATTSTAGGTAYDRSVAEVTSIGV